MRATGEEIQTLMAREKRTTWAIAGKAFQDAAKQLKPKKGQPEPTRPQVFDRALVLLKEPARQPAAVAALKRFKTESGLPLKVCREIMEAAGHAFEAAKALAGERGHTLTPPPPKLGRKVIGGLVAGETLLLLLRRTATLTPKQKREQKSLAYNGEHVPTPSDTTLVARHDGVWRVLGPHQRTTFDLVLQGDTVVFPERFRECTRLHRVDLATGAHTHQDLPALLGSLCGGPILSSSLDPAYMRYITHGSPRSGTEIWAEIDGKWSALPPPPGTTKRSTLIPLGSNEHGVWASSPTFFGYWDGADWVAVDCEPAFTGRPLGFTELAFGPGGELAGIADRNVWFGTPEKLESSWFGLDAHALTYWGDRPVVSAREQGIFSTKPGYRNACLFETRTVATAFAGSEGLYVAAGAKLQFSPDGETFSAVDLKPAFKALGHEGLWWPAEKPLG